MTRDQFDALIRRLEEVSQKHPQLYIARITGLVLLAYAYLLLVLVGSFALVVAMIAMVIYAPGTAKLAFIGLVAFGGMFWAVLRGLWVKLEPPLGLPVTREQAPKLFALLDELRTALNCKPFDRVLFMGDMNAAVVQVPRLGIFGWYENYLLIGLPLMQSLASDEFKAVLAHEFAHSSRGHGRYGNWLYRVRRTWERVFDQMAKQRTRGTAILFKFLNWFWPVFNGHAFVLARANEYEADACSVRLAGADAAARALMRLPVTGSLLSEKFWPQIFMRSKNDKEPPANVMMSLGRTLKDDLLPDDAHKWLRRGFLMETSNADTHPCLRDRLRAIGRLPDGVEPGKDTVRPPPVPPQSAAEFFLGDQVEIVARRLSEDWRKAILPQWTARHQEAQKLAAELVVMEQSAASPLTAGRLWEKALKIIQLHDDQKALPVIEQVLALEPKHPGANFVLGRHRLKADDGGGVALIESAMDADPELTQGGCNQLHAYYTRTGQRDRIRALEERMDKFQQLTVLAQRERTHITAADTFNPHELTAAELEKLRRIFRAEPDISSAAVARKQVEHFRNSPCYVVALDVKVPWWKPRRSSAGLNLVNRVLKQLQLPGHTLVFIGRKKLLGLGTRILFVPGAVVYQRVTRA
jgi:Zn-dependent protease with chaperone function